MMLPPLWPMMLAGTRTLPWIALAPLLDTTGVTIGGRIGTTAPAPTVAGGCPGTVVAAGITAAVGGALDRAADTGGRLGPPKHPDKRVSALMIQIMAR